MACCYRCRVRVWWLISPFEENVDEEHDDEHDDDDEHTGSEGEDDDDDEGTSCSSQSLSEASFSSSLPV